MQRRRLFRTRYLIEAAAALGLLAVLMAMMVPVFLDAQNINTPENFPDPNFRRAVERFMGVEDGAPIRVGEAREKTGTLGAASSGITSIQGLQFFPKITSLILFGNPIQNLDLSQYVPDMEELNCQYCQLTRLDVSSHAKLKTLECNNNSQLSVINLNGCNQLMTLKANHCALNSIDLQGAPHLKRVSLQHNFFQRIDLSHNMELETIFISENRLSELNLTNQNSLYFIDASINFLSSLDLSSCDDIQMVFLSENQLHTLLFSDSARPRKIYINKNRFTSIPEFETTRLETMDISLNPLPDMEKRIKQIELLIGRAEDITENGYFAKGFKYWPKLGEDGQ